MEIVKYKILKFAAEKFTRSFKWYMINYNRNKWEIVAISMNLVSEICTSETLEKKTLSFDYNVTLVKDKFKK